MAYVPAPFVTTAIISATTKFSLYPVEVNKMMLDSGSYLAAQVALLSASYSANTGYSAAVLDWRQSMMSKAEFNAMAAERLANRGGSGFDSLGAQYFVDNLQGIRLLPTNVNSFFMGSDAVNSIGNIKECINGVIHKHYDGVSSYKDQIITLPPAPTVLPYTATLTQQQIDSGVIKHADASNSGLIVNGKFDTDTSGWTASSTSATAIVITGEMEVTTTADANYYQIVSGLVVGKKYIFNGKGRRGTSINVLFRLIGAGDTTINLTSTINELKSFEFVAATTTLTIACRCAAAGTGYFANIAVFPADAISRQDFVYLRKKTVDLSVNDFFYPLGNTQFLGTTSEAGTTVAGAFASSPTYSLFSDLWQADSALIGKGYVWSTLSDLNKKAVTVNPENNTYLDGDKVYQAQYGAKVEMMKGDTFTEATSFAALGYTIDTIDKGLYKHADGSEALPITLVHRRNQGMMHPVYNPNGTKLASDSLPWYSTTVSFTSIADCFTDSKLLTASGYIGTVSGRSDGLFYDQIHEGDITDLRMNSAKVQDYNRLIDREFNRLVAGTVRGTEGEWVTSRELQTTSNAASTGVFLLNALSKVSIGDTVSFFYENDSTIRRVVVSSVIGDSFSYIGGSSFNRVAGTYIIVSIKSTRTKSNTLTHTDILGSPANYPIAWKQSGVSGVPLIVAEDGTSLLPTGTTGSDGLAVYKLSRKANATPLQVLKSTDSGVTWTALTVTTHYTFSTFTNAITFTAGNIPLTTDLIRVIYQTHTNMAIPTVNSEVLAIGDVTGIGNWQTSYSSFTHSLINKVGTGNSTPYNINAGSIYGYHISQSVSKFSPSAVDGYPSHTNIILSSSIGQTPAVKVFPYLTRSNGKAYLNLVFKEMKYGSYAAPTVVTAASATYTINMTYKINIAGCALDGKVIQWVAATATSAIDWSLYDVSPTGVIYLLSSGVVYASARLYDGDSWGDDAKFNIVDNVSTTTDNNAQTVLIGQKRIELPYFIGAAE